MWEFAPQKKDFFWGSKYWDPFLFHITNLVKSLGTPLHPAIQAIQKWKSWQIGY
jgi:hypothetical protein